MRASFESPTICVARQVRHVRDADERQQVVLAQGVELDLAGDDQLVVAAVVGERGRAERLRRELLDVRVDHPPRRLCQRPVLDVDAERLQQLGGCRERALTVDVAGIDDASGGALEAELVAAV